MAKKYQKKEKVVEEDESRVSAEDPLPLGADEEVTSIAESAGKPLSIEEDLYKLLPKLRGCGYPRMMGNDSTMLYTIKEVYDAVKK